MFSPMRHRARATSSLQTRTATPARACRPRFRPRLPRLVGGASALLAPAACSPRRAAALPNRTLMTRQGGPPACVHGGPRGESATCSACLPRAGRLKWRPAGPRAPGGLPAHPADPDRSSSRCGTTAPSARRETCSRPLAPGPARWRCPASEPRRPISSASPGCGRRREIQTSAGSLLQRYGYMTPAPARERLSRKAP